jgi:hypothetical protein
MIIALVDMFLFSLLLLFGLMLCDINFMICSFVFQEYISGFTFRDKTLSILYLVFLFLSHILNEDYQYFSKFCLIICLFILVQKVRLTFDFDDLDKEKFSSI